MKWVMCKYIIQFYKNGRTKSRGNGPGFVFMILLKVWETNVEKASSFYRKVVKAWHCERGRKIEERV